MSSGIAPTLYVSLKQFTDFLLFFLEGNPLFRAVIYFDYIVYGDIKIQN